MTDRLQSAIQEAVRIRGFRNIRHLWNMAEVRLSAKEKKSLCWEWEVSIPSCMEICKGLKDDGYDPTFVNARFVKPLDVDLLDELAKDHSLFVTVEENSEKAADTESMCLLIWKPVIRK